MRRGHLPLVVDPVITFQQMLAKFFDRKVKLHESASRWGFVSNFDRLQLPYRAAGDVGSLHRSRLFLQLAD